MTATVLAAGMAVLGIAALATHHLYRRHRELAQSRRRFAANYPARLARINEWYPFRHDIDGAYREMLARAAAEMDQPYDGQRYALSPMGEESLVRVLDEQREAS